MTAQNSSQGKLYTLRFEKRPNYLYAFVEGEKDSYEISRQYWKEIVNECRRLNCKKVLIEENIRGEMSTTEMYRLTSEVISVRRSGIRVAFVDRHFRQQELNRFGELVATNRGFPGKIFDDVEAGEKWLLSK